MQKTSNINVSIVDVQKFKIIKLQPWKFKSRLWKLKSNTFILKSLKCNVVSHIDFVKVKRLHMNLSHCHVSLETLFGRYACVDSKVTHKKDTNTVEHLQLPQAASQKLGCLFWKALEKTTSVTPDSSHPAMHFGKLWCKKYFCQAWLCMHREAPNGLHGFFERHVLHPP